MSSDPAERLIADGEEDARVASAYQRRKQPQVIGRYTAACLCTQYLGAIRKPSRTRPT